MERENKVQSFNGNSKDNKTVSKSEAIKRKPGKYQKLFKEFSQESSAGGINKVFSSKPAVIRFIWVILCLVCYGAMVFLSYSAVNTYFSNPTTTFIDVSFETDLPFPAITICNLNKFRAAALHRDNLLPNVSKFIFNTAKKSQQQRPPESDWQSTDEQRKLFLQKARRRSGISDANNEDTTSTVSSTDILEMVILQASASYSETELKKAGHQFENLAVGCQWMGLQCDKGSLRKYWRNIWNWKYGNCFTFNSGIAEDNSTISQLRTNKAGPKYGLTLDLFIEQDEYIKQLSEEAGVKVVIVDSNKHPFPFQEGVAVSPGAATAIALRKEVIKRVDRFSNGSCHTGENFKSIYDASLSYSIQSCLDTCLVEQQIKECNCTDARYAKDGNACSSIAQSQCVENVEMKYNRDEYGCIKRCPQGCGSTSYRTTISEAQSSTKYMEHQRENFGKNSKLQEFTKTDDSFKKNFLRVKIYYEELNMIHIYQEFSYPLSSLLSDIGGQLGLWVGLSVITFAEVGDLLVSLIMLAFSRNQ